MSPYRVNASARLLQPLPAPVRGLILRALDEVAEDLNRDTGRPIGTLHTLPIPGGYGISYLVSRGTRMVTLMVVAQPKHAPAAQPPEIAA